MKDVEFVTHDFQASSVVLGLSSADLAAEKSHCPFLSTPLRSQRDNETEQFILCIIYRS